MMADSSVPARPGWTDSREGDWAVGGAVVGLAAALLQMVARRWVGRREDVVGYRGREEVVGYRGRQANRRMNQVRNRDIVSLDKNDDFKPAPLNDEVFDNIETEYYKRQYTKHTGYGIQHQKYDLGNLNTDFGKPTITEGE